MRLEGGQLVASLVRDGPPLSRGQTVPLISGSLEVYADKPGRNRRVDIIKPGVEVQVVQPWIKTSNGGYYAQR